MFNWLNKLKIIWVVVIVSFWLQSQIFGFDLLSEISTKIQKFSILSSDDYLNASYESNYSRDPFWDVLKNMENMNNQLKKSGINQVRDVLDRKGCSISNKKIWWILYYFVPEFRSDIARSLKMELWNASNQDFIMDKNQISVYCEEYYVCEKRTENKDLNIITAWTSEDIMTNCKEFFERAYYEWYAKEKRIQNVQKSWIWSDKYRNASVEDSPYDIMVDLSTIWRLFFEDSQPAIQPVFYYLPIFKNSKNQLSNDKKSDWIWWISGWWDVSLGNNAERTFALSGSMESDFSNSFNQLVILDNQALSGYDLVNSDNYDDLIEGLWWVKLKNSLFNGRMCVDENVDQGQENQTTKNNSVLDNLPESNLSDEEYQEVVKYLESSVDKYTSIPEEKLNEIKNNIWDVNRFDSAVSESQLENMANEIKSCWKWCEWLPIDQKASCMLMCSCWQINSPIFDPKSNPWLWPVFMIRFCTIPAVDMKFSVGWRKIISIEEWVKEIYAVVDKLSREWKLWMWTQQYNFLDSTTKKINIAKTFAFTIDVEWVDIAENLTNYSEHYRKFITKKNNKLWQQYNNISNSLEDPTLKNNYRLVGSSSEIINDYWAYADADAVRNAKENLEIQIWPFIDQSEDAIADRFASISLDIDNWTVQQAWFWISILNYIQDLDKYSKLLYSKKG